MAAKRHILTFGTEGACGDLKCVFCLFYIPITENQNSMCRMLQLHFVVPCLTSYP